MTIFEFIRSELRRYGDYATSFHFHFNLKRPKQDLLTLFLLREELTFSEWLNDMIDQQTEPLLQELEMILQSRSSQGVVGVITDMFPQQSNRPQFHNLSVDEYTSWLNRFHSLLEKETILKDKKKYNLIASIYEQVKENRRISVKQKSLVESLEKAAK